MKNILLFLLLFCLSACKVNHLTGKKSFNVFSNKQLFPMALNQYESFLKENTIEENTSRSNEITQIGKKIAQAAQSYYEYKGASEYLKDYQ